MADSQPLQLSNGNKPMKKGIPHRAGLRKGGDSQTNRTTQIAIVAAGRLSIEIDRTSTIWKSLNFGFVASQIDNGNLGSSKNHRPTTVAEPGLSNGH
jgi:hypothetical protein